MPFRQLLILTIVMMCTHSAYTQVSRSEKDSMLNVFYPNAKFAKTDSGIFVAQSFVGICKQQMVKHFFVAYLPNTIVREPSIDPVTKAKKKLLTIHGNITYFFNYRSYIDTPFAEKDVVQHAVQTRLNVLFKEKYPFAVYLTSRRSNSNFFSNATDFSFQFQQAQMLENIKKEMLGDVDKLLLNKSLSLTPAQLYQRENEGLLKPVENFAGIDLKENISKIALAKQKEIEGNFKQLYNDYKEKIKGLEVLQTAIKKISGIQELVEEKERALRNKPRDVTDSLEKLLETATGKIITEQKNRVDSLLEPISKKIDGKMQEFEKLQKEIVQSEQALKVYQKKITDSLQKIKKMIVGVTDKNKLEEYLKKTGGSIKELPAMQRLLLSVKQIGLGRSWIDYSELTVKNVSLSGFNLEMNPDNLYIAAAAGKVNYGFRDYIVKGSYASNNQSVGLIRAGFGKKGKNNIIVTYYTGKKAMLVQTGTLDGATQHIAGVSIESRKQLNQHSYVIGEYARSASPVSQTKIFDFSNPANESFGIKIFNDYGNTKLNGYYRKTGEAFQSFTLFPTNSKQDAWMLQATQALWKKRILLDAAIRKNDFNSPIAIANFSNKNVFKSFQVTARIPKYPFMSAGYYPSSQLTLSNDNVLFENRYNTLNVIVSHTYFVGKLSMHSNATYTQFYNSGSDTGFIYYNASTLTFTHSVDLAPFTLQGIIAITNQSFLKQTTIEPMVSYYIKNKLSLSGSIKWNRLNHTETLWGGTAGLNLYLKRIGTIQMQYDKIYLPGYNRNLLPVNMGRLIFSREF